MPDGEREQPTSPRLISDAILLALAPAVAYGIAFAYESGFAKHFTIPLRLISISIEDFFLAVGAIFALAVLLFWLANLALSLVPEEHGDKLQLFYPLFYLVSIIIIVLGLFWHDWKRVVLSLTFPALILFLFYGIPTFSIKKIRRLFESIRGFNEC